MVDKNKKVSMRDAFFNKLYDFAERNRNLIIVTADMGAPSLDRYKRDLKGQFLNVGIAEHDMMAIAAGLAREGKNVFTYAIAPFITSRCYEFTKLNASLMQIPIKLVGVGAGFSYDDSGPTHHTTEDIAIMRALPGIEILNPSDIVLSTNCAEIAYNSDKPMYIRLDREVLPQIYPADFSSEKMKLGFDVLKSGNGGCIISTGNMVHKALEVRAILQKAGADLGVIDIYRLKPIDTGLIKELGAQKKVITLEEHLLDGGLGSIIAEVVVDNSLPVMLKRIGLRNYVYAYGGRESVREAGGIGTGSILRQIQDFL